MKKQLLWIFVFMLMVSFVSAGDIRFYGKQNNNLVIIDHCYIDNLNCDSSIPCNITITNSGGGLISNKPMTNTGFYLNYTFINTSTIGLYQASVNCIYNSTTATYDNFFFEINPSGYTLTNNNGTTIISIFIGLALLALILLLIYKFVDDDHWLFKIIILFFIPLIIVSMGGFASSVSLGTSFENIGNTFYQITLWFMRLFYIYVILAFVISILQKVNTKK